MKNILLSTIVLIFLSCKSNNSNKEYNVTVPDPDEEYTAIMVGPANREGLQNEPFNEWFKPNFESYTPDSKVVEQIKPLLSDLTVKIFMGTWCEDSQYAVPNFYKTMDTAGFDYTNFELVTVTREKDTPQQLEKGLDIINVPTIIFYKDGKEMNRIVEYAIESLEKDILKILSNTDYKHAYAE